MFRRQGSTFSITRTALMVAAGVVASGVAPTVAPTDPEATPASCCWSTRPRRMRPRAADRSAVRHDGRLHRGPAAGGRPRRGTGGAARRRGRGRPDRGRAHDPPAPGLNLIRHPYAGRAFEHPSEDPFLAGDVGVQQTLGIQHQDIQAQIKHLAGGSRDPDAVAP